MQAHYLQHVSFEGPGSIEPWLTKAGFTITNTRLFETTEFPDVDIIDFLIVMGGPMSVNDEERFPWFRPEKQFIRDFIETGKPTLGICLGAQLIANTLGAPVYSNSEKEIGWFPIEGVPFNDISSFQFSSSMNVFHWHGETFDLPPGATLLASSQACKNQAFQIGKSVMGLQFHLETTPESAQKLVANCRHELTPSRYIQTEEEILSVDKKYFEKINQLMGNVLQFLL